jgi:signal transduction histidine kinase
MTRQIYDSPLLFEAFVKASQYIVRLNGRQDLWSHLGKLVVTHFPAAWTAFAYRDSAKEIVLDNCSLAEPDKTSGILTEEARLTIADVLETGFLATKTLYIPASSITVFLPIVSEMHPPKVMLVGHDGAEPPLKELLNIYLAIAGLAGANSERMESERELIRHRANLEELVKDATAELTVKAKELSRSNEDLERFAYVASHDLQEPLRAITGFLGLLKIEFGTRLDDTAREYINFAVEGAERMSQLINDLLNYSRIGSREAEPASVDLNDVLSTAIANLHSSIKDVNATVTHDQLPTVLADYSQAVQVFQNLIGNGIKFRDKSRPCRVHVGSRWSNDGWTLWVNDNGIGIPREHFEKIFIVFQRLHTREKYPGTGIGLAICKRIVERHGGRIWIESMVGEGSSFFFTLPSGDERELRIAER